MKIRSAFLVSQRLARNWCSRGSRRIIALTRNWLGPWRNSASSDITDRSAFSWARTCGDPLCKLALGEIGFLILLHLRDQHGLESSNGRILMTEG